ncbi:MULTISPECIES: aminopeptidase P family protein [Auritidibacter]|uniref:aminopeptidase P family protein n=1 Tax=Auritidibacter TaxID=1160973 RepID=UPI000D72D1E0|nr:MULTISPECIES: aminopeptidase P family protein [Auritidibacter]NIH71576.1 Xaa-Pro aminopeptidase [Auritidibacter ignavus]PXA77406.1 Xaa-Pro aminopeptidase [Auritidibacter sp. NML100628]RMX24270.1 aminopeptidase P family protein [Auritidibacter ignavus]WGH86286.1 aminopeptidase P family protein [Auritidibacter ignavus]WGH88570.1 aminopeptidase P family protein [Auritidibacter ignavus]
MTESSASSAQHRSSTSRDQLDEQPEQALSQRGENRSRRPESQAFKDFMGSQWAPVEHPEFSADAVASYAATRRKAVSERFPGERLIIPAGAPKVRSNDTDYRFRPHSAFTHLTGLGIDHEPDAALVMQPVEPGTGDQGSGHVSTLYFRPLATRDSEEFYANAKIGEFWVGPRPTLRELEARTGLKTKSLDELEYAVTVDAGAVEIGGTRLRVVRGADLNMEALVDTSRINTGVDLEASDRLDAELSEYLSELRLVKDEWEIGELRGSVDATARGFDDIIRALPAAKQVQRGERVIETAFFSRARLEGNDLGYDTIAAAGNNATILHWIRNTGPIVDGQLLLVDAGVEAESLYTADITRTLPINGRFSELQAQVYNAVLAAADAAFEIVRPGIRFRDVHDRATEVLAQHLDAWGILPVSVDEAVSLSGQQHRRWMPHGTSHHLGLDVHDCAQARRELYMDGVLEPGMVFTIEPGLYFKNEDLAVPAEYRGLGIRIEDDILVTDQGAENLSATIPRTVDEVEAWMASLLGENNRQ